MNEQLQGFFDTIGTISRVATNAQRRLDRELATGFNATTLLQPKELRLSDTIACLLDPAAAHGQECVFLDEFITMFNVHGVPADRRNCRVAREEAHLDVLIEIGSIKPFGIGIENKPWAGDGANQVSGYCDYLERHFRGQWWFGYLSGNGLPPSEYSIEPSKRECLELNGRFRTIPFARSPDELSIEDWLTGCVKVCKAERVRWFLRDMLDYVGINFAKEP
jgi:hypothetical protein